jgi:hypothetical protein
MTSCDTNINTKHQAYIDRIILKYEFSKSKYHRLFTGKILPDALLRLKFYAEKPPPGTCSLKEASLSIGMQPVQRERSAGCMEESH